MYKCLEVARWKSRIPFHTASNLPHKRQPHQHLFYHTSCLSRPSLLLLSPPPSSSRRALQAMYRNSSQSLDFHKIVSDRCQKTANTVSSYELHTFELYDDLRIRPQPEHDPRTVVFTFDFVREPVSDIKIAAGLESMSSRMQPIQFASLRPIWSESLCIEDIHCLEV